MVSPNGGGGGGSLPDGTVQHIHKAYDPNDSENSARSLIFSLSPEWETKPGEIKLEAFNDGITNTLYKATKHLPGLDKQQIEKDAILLRSYGNGTEAIIDREREAFSHQLLASHGLAPELLARFNNGLLYSYIDGTPCKPADLRRDDVWPATAKMLGQWHGTVAVNAAPIAPYTKELQYGSILKLLPSDLPHVNIWTVMRKWIDVLPNSTEAERERNAILLGELEACTPKLGGIAGLDDGSYVYCHCDLLSGNVIVKSPEKTTGDIQDVRFIDYEYMTPGPAAFDLANHFTEWGGLECDYSVLPTRSQRRNFLKYYVASYRRAQRDQQTARGEKAAPEDKGKEAEDVQRLEEECDKYRGMPGFFWGLWALIQAKISQIDFDYTLYAEHRLGEYWSWKAEQDGSRESSGKEKPLRERRLDEE